MPLKDIQLLLRPQPGGLEDHKRFVVQESTLFWKESTYSDLVLVAEDGNSVSCHQSVVGKKFLIMKTMNNMKSSLIMPMT